MIFFLPVLPFSPGHLISVHQRECEGVPADTLGRGGVSAGCQPAEETGQDSPLPHPRVSE